MEPWAPFPADGWAETVELLLLAGKPWPRAAAIFDLRWHIDQRLPLPGRPELVRRWGWTDWRVRDLLGDAETWWDTATKGSPPTSRQELEARAEVRQRRASNSPPTHLQLTSNPTTDEPPQSGDILQLTSNSPPTHLHTRVGDHPSLSLSRPRETDPPPPVDLRDPGKPDPAAGYPPAFWPELVRSVLEEVGIVPLHGRLAPREAEAAAALAKAQPDRAALTRTARWILDAKDKAAARARGQIADHSLVFVLRDWATYDRAAAREEAQERAPPRPARLTDDQIFGPLAPRRPPKPPAQDR